MKQKQIIVSDVNSVLAVIEEWYSGFTKHLEHLVIKHDEAILVVNEREEHLTGEKIDGFNLALESLHEYLSNNKPYMVQDACSEH